MNGQQNPPQNQQQPQQHDPVDPANRPLHNSSSSIRDTTGLKSSEILNWLMLILMPPLTMVFCIFLVIFCGSLLYGTYRQVNPSNTAEVEKFHSKIVQLLVEGNTQMELKKLQNEIIDELRAIIEEQAKELDELHAKHGNGKGGHKGNKKDKEQPMEETLYWQMMSKVQVIFKFININVIIVVTLSACRMAYNEFIRPLGWDIRKWGWDNTIHFIICFNGYVLALFFPFVGLYLFHNIQLLN